MLCDPCLHKTRDLWRFLYIVAEINQLLINDLIKTTHEAPGFLADAQLSFIDHLLAEVDVLFLEMLVRKLEVFIREVVFEDRDTKNDGVQQGGG